MKTKTMIVAAIAGMAVFSSCQTKEQKLENAQENVADANADLSKAQREFREESENNLHENDLTIETYRANLKNEKEEMRAQYERRADSLTQRNKEMRAKLDNYKDDSNDNTKWESFKREFNHDMDEMKTSIKDMGKNNVK
jgi:exonuclease VII large subunit